MFNKILITGAAGFIGFHLSQKLLDQGHTIIGLDNLNDYCDPRLKQARLDQLTSHPSFTHVNIDLADRSAMEDLFSKRGFDAVVNLAAQALLQYSPKNPHVPHPPDFGYSTAEAGRALDVRKVSARQCLVGGEEILDRDSNPRDKLTKPPVSPIRLSGGGCRS